MAAPPLTFLERKWATGTYGGGGLIEGAKPSMQRRSIGRFDRDVTQKVGPLTRVQLLSVGQWLYENFAPVRAGIDQIAALATANMSSQFAGEDRDWGDQAEAALRENDRQIDLAGWPYDYNTYRRLLVAGVLIDGDFGTYLTQQESGTPAIQMVPGHRIGSAGDVVVKGGEFDGALLVDGVIVESSGRPLGYRILDEAGRFLKDVSARDMMLAFAPKYPGQVRGYSALGASILDWQDVAETRAAEKAVQKKAACWDFVVENESGQAELPSALLTTATERALNDTSLEASGVEVVREKMDGALTHYYRAGLGAKITPLVTSRPTGDQRAFEEQVLRSCFASIGWSYDLVIDATRIGGASLRVVTDLCNRTLRQLREGLVVPSCRRLDGWRVARFIKLGVLPEQTEWFRWAYQPPAELTSDRGYESDISIQEIRSCLSSHQKEANRRGDHWQDLIEARIEFEKYLQKRCQEEEIDPARISSTGEERVSAETPERLKEEQEEQRRQQEKGAKE